MCLFIKCTSGHSQDTVSKSSKFPLYCLGLASLHQTRDFWGTELHLALPWMLGTHCSAHRCWKLKEGNPTNFYSTTINGHRQSEHWNKQQQQQQIYIQKKEREVLHGNTRKPSLQTDHQFKHIYIDYSFSYKFKHSSRAQICIFLRLWFKNHYRPNLLPVFVLADLELYLVLIHIGCRFLKVATAA